MKIIAHFQRHTSLIMMVIGTISLLLLNLILRGLLSEVEYGQYSIFITYVSLLGSLGLLGVDQIFLRVVTYEKGIFSIPMSLIKIVLITGLFSSFSSSLIFKSTYLNDISFIVLSSTSYCCIWIISFYNIFRIQSKFFVSQFINNLWKALVLIIIAIIYKTSNLEINLPLIVSIFLFSTAITVFISGIIILKNPLKIKNQQIEFKTLFKLGAGFFLSLVITSFLNLGERFLIEHNIGLAELGNYFFLATFFLFPFSFMQGYIGFKELVYFKSSFSTHILQKKLLNSIIYGAILAIMLLLAAYALAHFNIYDLNIKSNKHIIMTLIFLGIIRLCYSIFSAAIGAVIGENHIITLNLISLFFILFSGALFFIIDLSLIQILLLFSVSWIFRIFIFYRFLIKETSRI